MISVVGAGLAGRLLALELATRGLGVCLIDDGNDQDNATTLSYGLLPWTSATGWRRLQRRHGDLGLQQRWLQLGGSGLPLPALQVDPTRFVQQSSAALAALGVERRQQRLSQLPRATPVVLACGAGCRTLAPELDPRLRVSWAGILELERPWSRRLLGWRAPLAQLPERFARLELERRAPQLQTDDWVVDAGLVPCGQRLLAGQLSLVRPDLEPGPPPEPELMEQRLRHALAQRWPLLASAPGRYRQAPVSFCSDGVPLAGPCGDGLWVLAGFSGAFAQIPDAAACLAEQLAANYRS